MSMYSNRLKETFETYFGEATYIAATETVQVSDYICITYLSSMKLTEKRGELKYSGILARRLLQHVFKIEIKTTKQFCLIKVKATT